MAGEPCSLPGLEFWPVTPDRWKDLEMLFGERGACAGCWCMWWRLPRSQWVRQRGEANRRALKQLVDSGEIPGILAYSQGRPVGWCSVSRREAFASLERSRVLKRIDDQPVWSVVCFFVDRAFRRRGLTAALLKAAVEFVRSQGGKTVEGYPLATEEGGISSFMGVASAFRAAGFVEVAQPTKRRYVMRCYL
ncbi:MAG: GNAT family N-acetyltransferase [Acetobacteraceae bacterium]|nr:GNAT family N-acetyltransferase [Acetobacteraceae bacterium]